MSNAHLPDSFADWRRFLPSAVLTAGLLAVLGACHAPAAHEEPEGPTPDEQVAVADGSEQETPRVDSDDEFDLFEDEYENPGDSAEPFTQEILDERVAFILPKVEELRGQKFKHGVPAGMQTVEEFIDFAMKDFEEEYGLDKFAETAEAYRLLGLIDPELDLLQTTLDLLRSQVGGYYDPKTKSFYMIDSFKQGGMADIILAHELTHALDDQQYDLQKMMGVAKNNADYEFAVRSVAEGSGTSLMNLFAMQGMLAGWISMDAASMSAMMADQTDSIRDAPPYLIITLTLPYMEGNKLLTRETETMSATLAVPKAEDLDYAFKNPPRSSEQVLHFEKYWQEELRDEPTVLDLPDRSAEFGDGWVLQDENVLGELGSFIMTAETLPDLATVQGQLSGRWTNEATTGWDGDLYQSYLGPNGERVLLWTSIWDSDADAEEFYDAYYAHASRTNSHLQMVLLRGSVVLAAYSNEAGKEAVATTELNAPELTRTR
jgi:hypothetical protein